jgi:hypothetical protein
MPTFKLNGAEVELVPQERDSFSWLASQVYRRIHEGPPLPAILTVFAHEGVTTQGLAPTDHRIQAILWTLWQLGIGAATVEGEGTARQAKWERGQHENIDGKPVQDLFAEDCLKDGRALACGLMVAAARKLRINGNDVDVKISNLDLLKAQAAEVEKRRKDPSHDPAMAAAAYVAELLSGGSDQNDLRLRAAVEIAADLGIRSMLVDAPTRQLRIDGFNEQAALAAAFFQNAPPEQLKAALTRVQTLNRMAEDQSRMIAQQAAGAGPKAKVAQAMVSPGSAAPGSAAPRGTPNGPSFKPRRRA